MEVATKSLNTGDITPEDLLVSRVDISVTADVTISRYFDSTSDDVNSNINISTSLNAIFGENSKQSDETDKYCKYKSLTSLEVPNSPSENILSQPQIRRSKKCTHLNFRYDSIVTLGNKRSQIDRTVVLPYFGCSQRVHSRERAPISNKNTVLVKLSRSYERILPNKITVESIRRSKSLDNICPSDNYSSVFEDLLSFSKLDLPRSNKLIVNTVQDSHIDDLKQASKILFDDEKKIRYLCTPIIYGSPELHKDKQIQEIQRISTSKKNIFLGDETIQDQVLSPKCTRNVSILHRPRMRNQATSTTSLNVRSSHAEQTLEDSIKDLLTPFATCDKDFPSELVLKLVSKKEELEKKKKVDKDETNENSNSSKKSEADLLVPMFATDPLTKPKKRKGIFSCFERFIKKKHENDDHLDGSKSNLSTEMYYPSAVEVHNKVL